MKKRKREKKPVFMTFCILGFILLANIEESDTAVEVVKGTIKEQVQEVEEVEESPIVIGLSPTAEKIENEEIRQASSSGSASTRKKFQEKINITNETLKLDEVEKIISKNNTFCGETIVNNYVMTNDIDCGGDGIIIGKNNIVLDCDNHIIRGEGDNKGILVNGKSNVLIKNCEMRNLLLGTLIENSNNVSVIDSSFYNIARTGIWVQSGNEILVDDNYFNENGYDLMGASRKIGGAVHFATTENSVVSNNYLYDNGDRLLGIGGILLFDSSNNLINKNYIKENHEDAIWIRVNSNDNVIRENIVINSDVDGIWIKESEGNLIEYNDVRGIGAHGIYINSASNNIIRHNTVLNASVNGAYSGIGIGGWFVESTGNYFFDNVVDGSYYGILVNEDAKQDNVFNYIKVSNTKYGIWVGSSRFGELKNPLVKNSIIENSFVEDVHLEDDQGPYIHYLELTLLNTIFDEEKININCNNFVMNECNLFVKWYLDVNVKEENGNDLINANVKLFDKNDNIIFSELTDVQGNIETKEVLDFSQRNDDVTYYNDHELDVKKVGFARNIETLNMNKSISKEVKLYNRLNVLAIRV